MELEFGRSCEKMDVHVGVVMATTYSV